MISTCRYVTLIRDPGKDNIRVDFLDRPDRKPKLKLGSNSSTTTLDNVVTCCKISHHIDKSNLNKAYTVMLCRLTIGGVIVSLPLEVGSIFKITSNTVVRKNEIIGNYRLARDGRILKLITEEEYSSIVKARGNRKQARAFRYTPGVYYKPDKPYTGGGVYVSPLYDISTKLYGLRSPDDRVRQWVGFKLADKPERYEVFIPAEVYELTKKDLTFSGICRYMLENGYIVDYRGMRYIFSDKFFLDWVRPEKVLMNICGPVAKDKAMNDLRMFLCNVLDNTVEVISHGEANGLAGEMLIPALRIGENAPKVDASAIDVKAMEAILSGGPEWFKWVPAKTKSVFV